VAQRYRVRTIVKATKSSNGERVIEKTAIHVDPNPRVTILPFRKGRLIRERKGEKDTVKRASGIRQLDRSHREPMILASQRCRDPPVSTSNR
jgi:hypothetical protein